MAKTPREILDAIRLGYERYVMADTVVGLTEEFRDDYVPGTKSWGAFQVLLICARWWTFNSVVGKRRPSRSSARPPTVNRRLKLLAKMGALRQDQPHRFVVVPEFMNVMHRVEGFQRRREAWHRADKKLDHHNKSLR